MQLDFFPWSFSAENPMLGSAPWLNTADHPMKTSIPSQRKESSERHHLLFQAWKQERGQELDGVESEKATERWHLSWRWVVERDSAFQLPSPEILPRTINNLKTGRRVKTRIRKWRWTTWRKKEDMDAIHHLVHGRPCRKGERTMLISPKIKIGVLIYQIVTCFSLLRPIRTMLEQSLVSHPHQVFFPSHQVTGYLFLLNLLIKKWWHFSLKHYLKSRLEMEIFIF